MGGNHHYFVFLSLEITEYTFQVLMWNQCRSVNKLVESLQQVLLCLSFASINHQSINCVSSFILVFSFSYFKRYIMSARRYGFVIVFSRATTASTSLDCISKPRCITSIKVF